jgi:pyruvate/2-oxoglutarate dehydrogenase complex dihydrolipoamide dehydrogenase (E3) component
MTRQFDAMIVGAGQAGPSLAGRLTAAGMTVALIERKFVGGTCVNTGCMPTKTLVASAYAAHLARRAADFGVMAGKIAIDMKMVAARAHKVTLDARSGNERWLERMDGLTFIRGHARFVGPDRLSVDGETLTAPRIFLNVGCRATVPNMPGINDVPYLDNTDMVGLDTLPEHLVVIGGSYIGLEFAQMYRRFGAAVTVVEREERIIAREDQDVSRAIQEILEDEGITVRTGANCIGFARHDRGVSVCPASGRSATATAAARSPTRRIMILRSSPPTFSTERHARSATASWAMRSTSIRRSAVSG